MSSEPTQDTTTSFDGLGLALLVVPAMAFGLSLLTDVPALPVFIATVVTSVLIGVDASRLRLGSRPGEFPAPLWCALALVPILWFIVYPAYMAVRAKSRGRPNLIVPAVIVAVALFGAVFAR